MDLRISATLTSSAYNDRYLEKIEHLHRQRYELENSGFWGILFCQHCTKILTSADKIIYPRTTMVYHLRP